MLLKEFEKLPEYWQEYAEGFLGRLQKVTYIKGVVDVLTDLREGIKDGLRREGRDGNMPLRTYQAICIAAYVQRFATLRFPGLNREIASWRWKLEVCGVPDGPYFVRDSDAVLDSLCLITQIENLLADYRGAIRQPISGVVRFPLAEKVREEILSGPYSFRRLCAEYRFDKEDRQRVINVMKKLFDRYFPLYPDLKAQIPWQKYVKKYDIPVGEIIFPL